MGSAVLGGTIGALAGAIGGQGTATKHMQSAFQNALHNGNWSYYITQVSTEAVRAGVQAIKSIARSSVPALTRNALAVVKRCQYAQ